MYWVLFFIYTFMFGFLAALAVKEKNRDQVNWFFIGFLFGIFGWITALAISKVEIIETAVENDNKVILIKCPKCNTTFNFQVKFCTNCGERLNKTCPNCSSVIPTNAKFCVQCGMKL